MGAFFKAGEFFAIKRIYQDQTGFDKAPLTTTNNILV